jgi:hypothetical protein
MLQKLSRDLMIRKLMTMVRNMMMPGGRLMLTRLQQEVTVMMLQQELMTIPMMMPEARLLSTRSQQEEMAMIIIQQKVLIMSEQEVGKEMQLLNMACQWKEKYKKRSGWPGFM